MAHSDEAALYESLRFRDITVYPYSGLLDIPQGDHHRGGPDWPDWGMATLARYWGSKSVVDVRPEVSEPQDALDAAVWAGAAVSHFGHMITCFSARILPSRRLWPTTPLLFAAHPRDEFTTPTRHPAFSGMLEWFGVPLDDVRIALVPTVVRDLRVVRQAEKWMTPPLDSYLDLLDDNQERNGLRHQAGPPLYVSRAGLTGRLAGERQLEIALQGAGVRVMRPEMLTVRQQLEAYAGTDVLVFAEGSAVHGLQLLGRGQGDLFVINRRPSATIAKPGLSARVRSLTYIEALRGHVHGLDAAGQPALGLGLAVLDSERLLDLLAPIAGRNLSDYWDQAAYERAVEADLNEWLARELGSGRGDYPGARDAMRATIEDTGLTPPAVLDDPGLVREPRSRAS